MRGYLLLTTILDVMTATTVVTMTAMIGTGVGAGRLEAGVKPSGAAFLGTPAVATAATINIGKVSGATGTAPATAMTVGAVARLLC
jgi:hypothetical protein